MDSNFWIGIGVNIILQLLSTKKIPASMLKALLKVRDALNMAFPPNLGGDVGKGFKVIAEDK